jgi:hypothetical protein
MPRLSTVSTPKKACKHTEEGVCIAKVMYVAKGKYIEYAKDGMYVADSRGSSPEKKKTRFWRAAHKKQAARKQKK